MLHSLLTAIDLPLYLAWFPSTGEWIIIAAFGLLLFGKRLPEVGRSLGKGIVEFKKGLKGVEDEVEDASNRPAAKTTQNLPPASEQKFDPYTGKPVAEAATQGEAQHS
jgi:sec-independent protein translocase protein TatA